MENDQSTPLIKAVDLKVGYHGRSILPAVNLEFYPGQAWLILGPNGSGKSTLVQTLLGLTPPVSGQVTFHPSIQCGYMEQKRFHDETIPSRAIDLVRSGRDRGWSFLNPFLNHKQKEKLQEVLNDVGIKDFTNTQFNFLSEGQKQRVLLAQALVSEPNLLVLDEPTSAMDPINESKIFDLLKLTQQKHQIALLMVSHQITAIPKLATHVIFLDQECNIALSGSVDQILNSDVVQTHYGQLLGSLPPHEHDDHSHTFR